MSDTASKLSTFAQIRALPHKPSLAISALLLERMYPSYALFSELCDFGDKTVVRNQLALVWEAVSAPKLKINLEVQSEKLELVTPDVADFDNFGVFPALDFCMALNVALQQIAGEVSDAAVTIAKLSQGSVEAYIQASEGDELQGAELRKHPLMQFEIESQLEALALCQQKPIPVEQLKAYVAQLEVSNLGISLA